MTTATIPTLAPLCESIHAVLTWLLGSGAGALQVDARSEAGLGHQVLSIAQLDPGFVPIPILDLLEHRLGWHIRVSPAVRDRDNPHVLLRTNVLFARWTIQPVFGPETGYEQRIALDDVRRVQHQIDAFTLRPSAIVDAAKEIVAVWRLTEPIDLRDETAVDRTRALQARLAGALETSTGPIPHDDFAAHDPRSFIPLAGLVREMGRTEHHVTIVDLNDRTYTLEQIEAAMSKRTAV